MKHFRILHRRMLRDALIAGAIAAVAASVPYDAYAHGRGASKQVHASAAAKNVKKEKLPPKNKSRLPRRQKKAEKKKAAAARL